MLEETPAELVTHLTNPNGWWRDTAQQLLVQRQDKSVVPALQHMARTSDSLVGRFHALWTLEGLGALDAGLVREAMADANPRMRIQAIRASETLYKAGDKSFADDYRRLAKDADVDVSLQALLTLNTLKVDGADDVIKATMAANQAWGIQQIGTMLLNPPGRGRGGFGPGVTPEQQALLHAHDLPHRGVRLPLALAGGEEQHPGVPQADLHGVELGLGHGAGVRRVEHVPADLGEQLDLGDHVLGDLPDLVGINHRVIQPGDVVDDLVVGLLHVRGGRDRPALGDLLTQAKTYGGFGMGAMWTSALFLSVIVMLVAVAQLSISGRRSAEVAE